MRIRRHHLGIRSSSRNPQRYGPGVRLVSLAKPARHIRFLSGAREEVPHRSAQKGIEHYRPRTQEQPHHDPLIDAANRHRVPHHAVGAQHDEPGCLVERQRRPVAVFHEQPSRTNCRPSQDRKCADREPSPPSRLEEGNPDSPLDLYAEPRQQEQKRAPKDRNLGNGT